MEEKPAFFSLPVILLVILFFSLGLAIGIIFTQAKKAPQSAFPPAETSISVIPMSPTVSPLNFNLPIDPSLQSVERVGVFYLFRGIITTIAPSSQDNKTGYEIEVTIPEGLRVKEKFFVPDNSVTLVSLDENGKEKKLSSLAEVKKNAPVFINYYLDLKQNPKQGQLTKITVLKN